MASLNINSLLAHIDELRVFLSDVKIDILSINETKLDSTIENNEVYIPGFEIVRNDRKINGRKGGGVCYYLRNNLNYTVRDDLHSDNLECLIVEITKPRSKPFIVGTWYRPPDSPAHQFDEFEELIRKIDAGDLEFYMLGDLNVNLMPGITSVNSSKLNNIFDIYGLNQLITEPTRTTLNSSTLLDLCVTNSPIKIINSGVIELAISDHALVFMTRKIHYERTRAKIIETRNLKNFNKDNFLRDLEQKTWNDVNLDDNPNDMWTRWKGFLMEAIDKHAPLKSKRVGNKKSPWITGQLLREMHKRDFLKKKAALTGDPQIWDQYKHARNYTNNEIKKAKRQYFTANLEINKSNPRKTWNLINELSSRHCSKSNNISEIKVGENIINTSAEMAETFNSYFSGVGENLAAEIVPSGIEPESYLHPTDKTFNIETPSVNLVQKLLTEINERKATGLDKIPCKLLKIAANIVAPSLTEIFTKSINTNIFPREWKLARVSPIFKKGAKNELNNYRPISVIPAVAKTFEKIIFDQLYGYLNENNLITSCQSGFRSLHSTLTALIEATNSWSVNIDNGLLNGVIFIDLKKAFDTIDHNIILRKLSNYGIGDSSLKWFESYLVDRSQKCSINGHLSNALPVTCGVPQGSILGPLLFLVYINDLPNCLSVASPRMFADDTSITIAADKLIDLENIFNLELNNLNCWLKANRLSLNITKTEFMVIGSRQRIKAQACGHIKIECDGKEIKRVDEVKSLGIIIDKNLSWASHIEEKSKKISSAIGALKRIRPFISISTATQVYQALIKPQFDYCSPVWDELSVTLSDKLQKLQNRAVRVITKSKYDTSVRNLLESLKLDMLAIRRKKLKSTLMFKTIKQLTPTYMQNLFIPRSTGYNIRNAENKLNLPLPCTNYLKRSFSYSGALLWNNLPLNIRMSHSLGQFKREIDQHYSED